jgi:hypothetical protein
MLVFKDDGSANYRIEIILKGAASHPMWNIEVRRGTQIPCDVVTVDHTIMVNHRILPKL